MIVEEKTISTERIYEGKILNLRRDLVTVRGNKTAYREIIEHNGAVAVAALKEDGKMIMVRQFRKVGEKAVLEIPAGKIEKGEDPYEAAVRELQEETGYTAGKMELLASFYSSIGYSTEKICLYLAADLTPGDTDFDESEAIDIEEYDLKDLKEMVLQGKIEDAKSISAVLMACMKLDV